MGAGFGEYQKDTETWQDVPTASEHEQKSFYTWPKAATSFAQRSGSCLTNKNILHKVDGKAV